MALVDAVHRFTFEELAVRGALVQLQDVFQKTSEHAQYPEAIQSLLGQALCASALMSSTIKYDGRLTLQVQGQGALRLLLAQSTNSYGLRGMARYDGDLPAAASFAELTGKGRTLINIQADKHAQPWQGVIDTQYPSVAAMIEAYFGQSEQLDTKLILFSKAEQCFGLLLQKLPNENSDDADGWDRVCQLAETLTAEEALSLEAAEIVNRLFHEEIVRVYEPHSAFFNCVGCADRVEAMLKQVDRAELDALVAETGQVEVTCEFCAKQFAYDAVDLASALASNAASASSRVQ
jgi:molecular chaperone Hsp33